MKSLGLKLSPCGEPNIVLMVVVSWPEDSSRLVLDRRSLEEGKIKITMFSISFLYG